MPGGLPRMHTFMRFSDVWKLKSTFLTSDLGSMYHSLVAGVVAGQMRDADEVVLKRLVRGNALVLKRVS